MYIDLAAPAKPAAFHDRIYAGEILRFRNVAPMHDLVAFTRGFLEDAFAPHIPIEIHRHLSHSEQAESFALRERAFAQSEEVKRHWRAIFEAVGLDAEGIARDRLHLRFQPHQPSKRAVPRSRATATIAFHRDT